MPRIVHFGKYYFPDAGGIESVTLSLAKGAAKSGYSVTVVCFKKTPAGDAEVIDDVQVIRAPISQLIASQPLGWKYVQLCLREARGADVIHVHTPNMLTALCCLFISKKSKLLVHWHSDVINKGLLGKLLRPLEGALLHRANCIVTTSQVYAEASPTLQPFRDKITVVPIGVPDTKKQDSSVPENAHLPADLSAKLSGKHLILAVGRLVLYKGFEVLIGAAKTLRDDAVVVIVGEGPLQETLKAAVETTGVADRVYLAGRLTDEELHALLDWAVMYCLPSVERSEAFGVVMLEAMAYGLPIVATNIPGSGVPWVNQHGVTGVNVPVGDPIALAQACNQILNSEEDRIRFSAGARRRFETEFTEDVFVKRMLATYDRLLESPRIQ